jgi:hypothetical protein
VSTYNKVKGSRWESDLEEYYNQEGLKARRLPRAGNKDIGDVAIELTNGHVIVVEAKNVRANKVAEWLSEADVEAENYTAKYDCPTYGVVVRKTPGKNAAGGVIMMTQETLINLLRWNNLT